MHCKSISFTSFRNIEKEKCEFADGVNVLWGKNAQGKTNILEGIYFFARGRSFRGAKERELVKFREDFSSLTLEFRRDGDSFPVELSANIPTAGRKTLYRGGAKLSSVKEMIGSFRAVLFCPDHLTLVSGGPAIRRSFLDIALSQLYPAYLDSLSKYNRALYQRNALIKNAAGEKIDTNIIEVYAGEMAKYGADIAARRFEYMTDISKCVAEMFSEMTNGTETPSLRYQSAALTEDPEEIRTEGQKKLYSALTENFDRELHYGASLYGIHKDDILIKLNGKEARIYASQGQQRSVALCMKLAEGELSKKITGEYPVFLLDDVLSELDSSRRSFVLSKLYCRQIIVTSCEPDIYSELNGCERLIHIENGKILETEN